MSAKFMHNNFPLSGKFAIERYASQYISTIPRAKWNSVPLIVAKEIAATLGIEIIDENDLEESTRVTQICSKIEQVYLKEGGKIRIPLPPCKEELESMERTQRRRIISSVTDCASLKLAGRVANSRESWNSIALFEALRHILLIDLAAKSVAGQEVPAFSFAAIADFELLLHSTKKCDAFSLFFQNLSNAVATLMSCIYDSSGRVRVTSNKDNYRPHNSDSIILYTICTALNINTQSSDTLTTLKCKLFKFGCANNTTVAFKLHQKYTRCKCATLIGSQERKDTIIRASRRLAGSKNLLSYITLPLLNQIAPSDEGAACALASFLFEVDLSQSECPVNEYYQLLLQANCHFSNQEPIAKRLLPNIYTPLESAKFGEIYKWTPITFNSSTNYFSYYSELYTDEQLNRFVKSHGMSLELDGSVHFDENPASSSASSSDRREFRSIIDALNFAHLEERVFTLGLHHNSINKTSLYSLEEFSDVIAEYGQFGILSFGHCEKEMVSLSIKDICDSFENMGALTISIPDGRVFPLTRRHIKQLVYLSNSVLEMSVAFVPLSAKECYRNILRQIRLNEIRSLGISEHGGILRKLLIESNLSNEVENAFRLLIEAGMYMRGWKVSDSTRDPPHKYPLRAFDTTYSPNLQDAVDFNVTLAINKYDEAIDSIPNQEVRCIVKSSPLLRMVILPSKQIYFLPPANTDQGISIEDRLAIIREGDASETVFACLRMSSNYIIASAYYYLVVVLKATIDFDIYEMSDIM